MNDELEHHGRVQDHRKAGMVNCSCLIVSMTTWIMNTAVTLALIDCSSNTYSCQNARGLSREGAYGAAAQGQLYVVAILGTPDEVPNHIVTQRYGKGLRGEGVVIAGRPAQ